MKYRYFNLGFYMLGQIVYLYSVYSVRCKTTVNNGSKYEFQIMINSKRHFIFIITLCIEEFFTESSHKLVFK